MFGNKSPFGGGTTNTFGGGSSLFGQNKPSVFGQPQQTQQTSSLFGSKQTSNLFGSSTQQGSSLFGSSSSTGNQPSSGGLFGQSKPSLFGASSSGASFGQTSTSLFSGNTNQGSSLFGSSSTPAPNGTTIKFDPVIAQDTMQKNGTTQNISTKHMCITAMKPYETKSLEELRVEDYLANRKTGNASSGLFSSTQATSQPSSVFGQSAQAKPLFGGSTSGTTFGGTSSAPLFGSTTGSSPFGAKPTTSLFGAGTTGNTFGSTQPTTSLFSTNTNTGFGAATQQPSLFGQPAATSATTSFTFGAPTTSTAAPFGQSTGGSLFSSNTGGGLFGKPAGSTANTFSFGGSTTTSAFGQPTAQTTSLFGAKPAQQTTSLFGSQPAANLFGSQPAAQPAPTFGAAPTQQPVVAVAPVELTANVTQLQMAILDAQLAASPYGDSSLLDILKPANVDSDDKPNPISAQRQLRFLASRAAASPLSSKDTKKSGSLTLPMAGSTKSNAQSPLITKDLNYMEKSVPPTLGSGLRSKPAMFNYSHRSLLGDLDQSATRLSPAIAPPKTLQNIRMLDSSVLDAAMSGKKGIAATPRDEDELPRRSANRERDHADTIDSSFQHSQDDRTHDPTCRVLNFDTTGEESREDIRNKENRPEDREEHPGGIRINSSEYYSQPSIAAMRHLVVDGKVVLPDGLTVGRANYGTVFWPGKIELSNIVLDEIVVFRLKEVTVYPDESKKPPEGKELNRKAEVTLERVWPVDKDTKECIKDVQRIVSMGWPERLEKMTSRMGAQFKDYRPGTGSWVFVVQHFSKYGLLDEDESMVEGELQSMVQRAKVPLATTLQTTHEVDREAPPTNPFAMASRGLGEVMLDVNDENEMPNIPEKKIKMEKVEPAELLNETERFLGVISRHRQVALVRVAPVRHFQSSVSKVKTHTLLDTSVRPLRVGFFSGGFSFPAGSHALLSTLPSSSPPESYTCDMFEHHLRLSHFITRHRSSSARARHCALHETKGPSRVKVTTDAAQLVHCFLTTARQSSREDAVLLWQLCQTVLPPTSKEHPWKKRALIGEWLRSAVAFVVDTPPLPMDTPPLTVTTRGQSIWTALTFGDVEGAVDAAVEGQLPFLATLLTTYLVNPEGTRKYFKQQVDEYSATSALAHVDEFVLKVYLLMAGVFQIDVNGKHVNILHGLHWMQVIGLRVWYGDVCSSLEECVGWLESECVDGHISFPPHPDVFLELLLFSVDRSRPEERVLDAAIAQDGVQLAWHLWSVCRSFNLPQLDLEKEGRLLHELAEQLWADGLAHLALFVLSHLHNDQCRLLAVTEMIDRVGLCSPCVDWMKMGEHLRMGEEGVARGRYMQAMDADDQLRCALALAAGELQIAHNLFTSVVAPNYVLLGDLVGLEKMCELFEERSDLIQGWGAGGLLYADYVRLKNLDQGDDEFDRLSELHHDISARIEHKKGGTPIERLCTKMIAREMAEIHSSLQSTLPVHLPISSTNAFDMFSHGLSI